MKSLRSLPKFSPLIVTLVPGGPSLGDTPVTSGADMATYVWKVLSSKYGIPVKKTRTVNNPLYTNCFFLLI